MENLDPLRQKPDFKAIVKSISVEDWAYDIEIADSKPTGLFSCGPDDVVTLLEHVWTSHVEPLMKKVEEQAEFIERGVR